ncbi:hypothetical protein DFH08DRAFT_1022709 [Mycena albidolilacea]|uniref:Uncharacterized protein n=1 Tax=Mycena albidolilacea TaxID=1033008 RepID=A0AAD7EKU1_9AGAR|nr:hypothetical protein DFH08DRAFT_1022709 [Mycena albidolilacea]
MSSSPLPATPRRGVDAMLDAMDELTPVAPRKRPHADIDPSSDNEDDEPLPANVFSLTSRNVTQMLQRLGESKRLRADQIADSINSVNDPPAVQGAKVILGLYALHNRLDAFEMGKPPFAVSDDTETNIYFYAAAILLSTKLSAYKGSDILKVNRFDLPPNIERNPADYAKLVTVVQGALTQLRSKIKKALAASFKVNKAPAPSAREHQNIFDVTTHLVQGTKCAVTPELCARVALMRQVYIEDPTTKFWDSLDADLRKIRNRAGGSARKLNKAFENVLSTDRATHGVDNYSIPTQAVDDLQREVDDTISAAAADKATSIPAATPAMPATEEPAEEPEQEV